MKNLGLKVTALVLALVVWSAVSAPRRGKAIERAFAASVSLVGMSRDYIITTPTTVPEKVSIRLRGRKADLDALTSRALEATVDLSWIQQAGEASITLRPQAFNVPAGVEVVSIDPNKFRFRVEELRQGTVAIRPFLLGEVADGYRLGAVTLDPDRALVSGPATQIQAMEEIATDRIILTGRMETFTQSVAVLSDSPLVRVVSPLTTRVTVPVIGEIGPPLPPSSGTGDENEPAPAASGRAEDTAQ
ncbi:MAG TPA: CdaR family protein [Thermoanaerobaculia bacterium]|nr:CdaR family protein [Thermoanaerobaculia bacterium]